MSGAIPTLPRYVLTAWCLVKAQGQLYRLHLLDTSSGYLSGIALGYELDDRGVRVLAGAGNFSLHHRVQTGSGAHPPSYPMGTMGSFPGIKRQGRVADHSPPSSAEVKNAWSYTFTPPIRLHGMVLS
jgi:hypothetical protein